MKPSYTVLIFRFMRKCDLISRLIRFGLYVLETNYLVKPIPRVGTSILGNFDFTNERVLVSVGGIFPKNLKILHCTERLAMQRRGDHEPLLLILFEVVLVPIGMCATDLFLMHSHKSKQLM